MNEENSQAKDGLPKPMKGNPVFKYARKFNKAKKFVDQKKRMKAGYSKHKGGMGEALDPSMGAGEYVKDFYKSDAPQFKGKSKSKRRQMAIAAYLKDKGQNEATAQDRFLNRLKKKHGYDPDEREKFYADMKKKFQQTSAKAIDSSKTQKEETKSGDQGLRDWFGKSKSSDGKKGWVQLGGKFAGKPVCLLLPCRLNIIIKPE